MFGSFYYPFYRSPWAYSYPVWQGGYYNNTIGSAIANQSSNQIGGIGNFSSQVANPVVI
jgi:hypothetical protein